MHSLKAENGVLFGRQNWGLKRRIQPQRALRDWSLEVWEEPGYRGVFPQRPGSQNIKRLLLIKENQTSQFSEFSPFLRMGRRKSLGSLTSSLWCALQLPGPGVLGSHPESAWAPSGVPCRPFLLLQLMQGRGGEGGWPVGVRSPRAHSGRPPHTQLPGAVSGL